MIRKLFGRRPAPLPTMTRERPAIDYAPSLRSIGEAEEVCKDTARAMMEELVLRYPDGSVEGVAFVIAKCAHPTGAAPYAHYSAHADNLDQLLGDTLLFGEVLDFIIGLDLPRDIRKELARRIMAGERLGTGIRHG